MSRVFAIACLFLATPVGAEDWPRWRGPRGDGTWNAPKLPEKWPDNGLKTVWRQPVGSGYAGITVAEGMVFTLDLEKPVARNVKSGPDATERVLCFDLATGKQLWSHAYPVHYGDLGGYSNGPRTSPIYEDGKLYTLGAVGHLFCFEARSGKIHWQHDTVEKFGARIPMWGFAASPILDGSRLIIHVGGKPNASYLALEKSTGKEIWRSLHDPAGYATPIVIQSKAGSQLIAWTPENIHGLDPQNGNKLWTVPHKVTYGVSIATPVFQENQVFVSEYWEGSLAIRLGEKSTDHEVVWTDRKALRGLMAQPLYRNGYVYTLDKDQGLTCFELKTGKILWTDDNQLTPKGRNPHASIIWINDNDRILALNSAGELVLARINPEGYHEQSRTSVLKGRIWGHPGFSGRFLLAKSDGAEGWQKGGPHELICVELAPEK